MIKSFDHKGLQELLATGKSRHVDPRLHDRCKTVLLALQGARSPQDMMVPGWKTHFLKHWKPRRWSVMVNGPWRITFVWENNNAHNVNLEQYH